MYFILTAIGVRRKGCNFETKSDQQVLIAPILGLNYI